MTHGHLYLLSYLLRKKMSDNLKKLLLILLIIGTAVAAFFVYNYLTTPKLPKEFAVGNGRLETTQIDISSKLSGRLLNITVEEGDTIEKDQLLATLDTKQLESLLQEAKAHLEQAKQNKNYSLAIVEQRKSELNFANNNYKRAMTLYKNKNISLLEFQKEETTYQTAKATLSAAKAQVVSANAAINAAKAQIETIQIQIDESKLYSPIKGRVLYKIAQNGEIISNGGRVLVVLDLMNTSMTIFLPTSQAGLVNIGSEARIVLDALPNVTIPSTVTFVSPQAQFTPKEIETQTEREKLMFRIKVRIDSKLLKKHFNKIKTGLPGIAYIKLDATKKWPESLNKLPKSVVENSVK